MSVMANKNFAKRNNIDEDQIYEYNEREVKN